MPAPKVRRLCANCKKLVIRRKCELTRKDIGFMKHSFCNNVCYGKWQSKHRCGTNNPAYGIRRFDMEGVRNVAKRPEVRKKISLAQMGNSWSKGVIRSKEHKEQIRRAQLGKKLPEETKKKVGFASKQRWQDPTYRENTITKLKANWRDEEFAKDMGRRQQRRPSKPEKFLIELLHTNFQNEWKYVGDAKFWIDGRNPDFININGKKAVIEYNGYWKHTKEKDEAKTKHYLKYGFKTLNLYEDDLKNKETLIDKIRLWEHDINTGKIPLDIYQH